MALGTSDIEYRVSALLLVTAPILMIELSCLHSVVTGFSVILKRPMYYLLLFTI